MLLVELGSAKHLPGHCLRCLQGQEDGSLGNVFGQPHSFVNFVVVVSTQPGVKLLTAIP